MSVQGIDAPEGVLQQGAEDAQEPLAGLRLGVRGEPALAAEGGDVAGLLLHLAELTLDVADGGAGRGAVGVVAHVLYLLSCRVVWSCQAATLTAQEQKRCSYLRTGRLSPGKAVHS